MAIPGFAAETSLYRTSEHYKMEGAVEALAGLAVIPQQFGCICRCFTLPFIGRRCYRCCIWPPGCRRVTSC
jgi:hypothetical protein